MTQPTNVRLITEDRYTADMAGKADDVHTHVKGDVGLGNVDNTSDAAKPISTATQTALNGKSATGHTHAVSDVTGLQAKVDRVDAAPATWHWAGTTLPGTAAEVHAQARVGDFIVAPNLTTDPGWHRITGV